MPETVPPNDPAAPTPVQHADAPPARPTVERRRSERRHSPRLLHCTVGVAPGEPMLAAMVLDVSHHGIGLIVPQPVPPGTALVVRIPEAGQGRPALDLPARVAHCGELMARRHLVGAEFVRPLGEEELAEILARMRRRPARGG